MVVVFGVIIWEGSMKGILMGFSGMLDVVVVDIVCFEVLGVSVLSWNDEVSTCYATRNIYPT